MCSGPQEHSDDSREINLVLQRHQARVWPQELASLWYQGRCNNSLARL